MSQNSSISITAETYKSLISRREETEQKLVEAEKELCNLIHTEKDPTGNCVLQMAQNEISLMKARLMELNTTISLANIVKNTDDFIVAIGSKITIKVHYSSDQTTDILELLVDGLSYANDDDIRIVSAKSPIGEAVMGSKVSDRCQCKTPKGEADIEIISISHR